MLGIGNEWRPLPRNTNYMPQYLETATLEVWAKDGKSHGMEELLKEIDQLEYDGDHQMRGIQELDRRLGKFKITFKGNKEMKEMRRDWASRGQEDTKWTPIINKEDSLEEINRFTLQGIPMEYPLEMTREHLKKYVEQPVVDRATIPGRSHLYNGDITVQHQGLKIKIENKIWVGPGISAWVKGLTQRPMTEWRPKCSRCQELGHLAPNCENVERCRKCRGEGHHARECKWCRICRRNGHETENCLHNPEAGSPEPNENTANRERRDQQRHIENEHQKRLQQVMPRRQQNEELDLFIPPTSTSDRYNILMETCPECKSIMEKGKCKVCNMGEAETIRIIRTSTPQAAEQTNLVDFSQHVAREKEQEQQQEIKTRQRKDKKEKKLRKKRNTEVEHQEEPNAQEIQEERERDMSRRKIGISQHRSA